MSIFLIDNTKKSTMSNELTSLIPVACHEDKRQLMKCLCCLPSSSVCLFSRLMQRFDLLLDRFDRCQSQLSPEWYQRFSKVVLVVVSSTFQPLFCRFTVTDHSVVHPQFIRCQGKGVKVLFDLIWKADNFFKQALWFRVTSFQSPQNAFHELQVCQFVVIFLVLGLKSQQLAIHSRQDRVDAFIFPVYPVWIIANVCEFEGSQIQILVTV